MSTEMDRLLPEIQPRAEPQSVFKSFSDDEAEIEDAVSENARKFSRMSTREGVLQNDRSISAFDADGGSRSRSGKRQRPSSRLMESEALDGFGKFTQAEDSGMVNNGMSHRRQRRRFTEKAADSYVHVLRQSQYGADDRSDDNAGAEAADDFAQQAGYAAGDIADSGYNRLRIRRAEQLRQKDGLSQGLIFDGKDRTEAAAEGKSSWIRRYYHKQRYKRMYAESRYAELKGRDAFTARVRTSTRIKAALRQAFESKKRALLVLGIVVLMVLLIMAAVSSCGATIHGLTSSFLATTYPSTDEDIHAVEGGKCP